MEIKLKISELMSNAQRETIGFYASVFGKVMMGLSGAVLLLLYYSIRDEAKQTRDEFRESIDKIEVTTKETNSSVNVIQRKMDLLEYRMDRMDKENSN